MKINSKKAGNIALALLIISTIFSFIFLPKQTVTAEIDYTKNKLELLDSLKKHLKLDDTVRLSIVADTAIITAHQADSLRYDFLCNSRDTYSELEQSFVANSVKFKALADDYYSAAKRFNGKTAYLAIEGYRDCIANAENSLIKANLYEDLVDTFDTAIKSYQYDTFDNPSRIVRVNIVAGKDTSYIDLITPLDYKFTNNSINKSK